ncbi:MAG: DNA-directed DNA polymerase [Candidatus Pacearchaeota archaeon]|nr:DNA-directed DNA polymerase [Candidatus Pacearchaeota archaeon]
MKIQFIPLDYDYFDFEGKNYAKIIGRDEGGKRVCIIDSCDVYFWAVLDDKVNEKQTEKLKEKIEKIQLSIKGRKTKVEKVELHKKKFLGRDVRALKIFATNYKDLHDIADRLGTNEIEKRRGYDLGFITHYIIERSLIPLNWYEIEGELLNNSQEFGGIDSALDVDFCIKLNSLKEIEGKDRRFIPKVLAFDIETDEFRIGKGKILMISMVSENFRKVLTWKKVKDKAEFVEYVKDEAELIERFADNVKKISPDFLTGYFSDGFDMPYLKARAEENGVKLSLGLDGTQPIFHRGAVLTAKIDGIVHIDLLKFTEAAYSQYMQSETLSLNDVAKEFLGDNKKEFSFRSLSEMSESDWKDYFEYNLHDSTLTYRLFMKFWPDLLEFSKVMQEPVFDVSRNGMSKNVEDYIIHNLDRFNEVPEKRPTHEEIGKRRGREKYEGAFVFQPTPGLYEDIVFFDFTSYWPSIIVTFNLSASTLLSDFVINRTPPIDKKRSDSSSFSIDNKIRKKEKDALEVDVSGKKFYFSKEPGFFPQMLKEIILLRKKYKQELKKKEDAITRARSNAFKLLANASYGYQGFFGARYYCPEASAATTSISRDFIKKMIESIDNSGFKTIYSDTDSIAFLRNKKSKSETLHMLESLNKELPGIMELELEDFYKRGIWVTKRTGEFGAKKKYALIGEGGKMKIRGFETVRRDWCDLARETQNRVLQMILDDGNEKRALNYVRDIAKKIKARKVGRKEILIRTQLTKPLSEYKAISPHVVAARRMEEQKIPIDEGALIEYYISEIEGKKKLVRDRVKLAHEEGEYDVEYYLKHQILPAVENIFQVFGLDINITLNAKNQMTLEGF